MADRTIIFIDYENAYKRARQLFHGGVEDEQDTHGHFDPWRLGVEICRLNNEIRRPSQDHLTLTEVRVYRGLPNARGDSRYGAAKARKDEWELTPGISVTTPTLEYDNDGTSREKEVDVHLAVDLVNFARDGKFDVGILFSADGDFRPAVRYIRDELDDGPRVDVAAWGFRADGGFITLEGEPKLIVHFVPKDSYQKVADTARYPSRRPSRANNRRRKRRRS